MHTRAVGDADEGERLQQRSEQHDATFTNLKVINPAELGVNYFLLFVRTDRNDALRLKDWL